MLDPSHAIGCTALAAAVLGVANPLSAIGPGMLMLAFWPVSWQSLYICVLTRVCWPAGGNLPSMAGPFCLYVPVCTVRWLLQCIRTSTLFIGREQASSWYGLGPVCLCEHCPTMLQNTFPVRYLVKVKRFASFHLPKGPVHLSLT